MRIREPSLLMSLTKCSMRGAGYVSCVGGMRNVRNISEDEPERTRPLRTHRRKWKGSSYSEVRSAREIGCVCGRDLPYNHEYKANLGAGLAQSV